MTDAVEFRSEWWGPHALDYEAGWQLQRSIHAQRVAGDVPDTVLLLEHPPVYTAGKRTEAHERPIDGTPVVDVDRGGKITFHGPGQLVGYPIVRLPDGMGVVDFVRRIEEAMIRTLADFDIACGRIAGRSGVWLAEDASGPERKIGAIGIRVAGGVTMHGLAINGSVDLDWFNRIVPCGIADAGVTSIQAETGIDVSAADIATKLKPHLRTLLAWDAYEPSLDVLRAKAAVPVLQIAP